MEVVLHQVQDLPEVDQVVEVEVLAALEVALIHYHRLSHLLVEVEAEVLVRANHSLYILSLLLHTHELL